mgnify:CR=1 FL=1
MQKFIDIIKSILKIKELKNKILFTLGLLLVYRVGAQIVLPGIDSLELSALSSRTEGGGLLGILNAFTGVHEDYHTPRDTSEKINYQGAERIVRLMAAMTKSILNRPEFPDYVEMKRPGRMGLEANLRAYLGTIPDYSRTEVAGVTLSGIIKGGPADQAGIQKGDQIVELADTRIQNIYDYTYAINSLKIGVAVKVVLMRDGKQLTLKITPRSRE